MKEQKKEYITKQMRIEMAEEEKAKRGHLEVSEDYANDPRIDL